jgi:hypothetical protein
MSDASLFSTPHGSALRCACCGRVEVTFRGVPFILTPDDLPAIQSVLRRVVETDADPDDVWEMQARSKSGPITVHYRYGDLLELADLIHGTSAMLELEQILEEVEAGMVNGEG